MEKTVQELKMIIRDLILEVGDLKERIAVLENSLVDLETNRINTGEDFQKRLQMEGENYESLGKIYNEGYHVCPLAFGQPRRGECLFCIAFIEKE